MGANLTIDDARLKAAAPKMLEAISEALEGGSAAGDTGDTFYLSRREFMLLVEAWDLATGENVRASYASDEA